MCFVLDLSVRMHLPSRVHVREVSVKSAVMRRAQLYHSCFDRHFQCNNGHLDALLFFTILFGGFGWMGPIALFKGQDPTIKRQVNWINNLERTFSKWEKRLILASKILLFRLFQ